MTTIIIGTQWYWWHPLTDAWWHYGCRGLPRSPSPWSWTHCKWWQCALETNSNLSECWPLTIVNSCLTVQYLYRKSKVSWALPDRSGWFSGLEIILRWSFLPLLPLLLLLLIIIIIIFIILLLIINLITKVAKEFSAKTAAARWARSRTGPGTARRSTSASSRDGFTLRCTGQISLLLSLSGNTISWIYVGRVRFMRSTYI